MADVDPVTPTPSPKPPFGPRPSVYPTDPYNDEDNLPKQPSQGEVDPFYGYWDNDPRRQLPPIDCD